jgi:riboflavin kinase/FMN adenylyltransferase
LKVYHKLSEYSPRSKAIVTVGTFDGVHIGHQKLLSTINEIAKREGGESVLLTFSPHPRLVLFPDDNDLRLLSTLEEKIQRLEKSGLQHLIIHPFTVKFSRTTAVEYVQDILVGGLGVHKLVIGYDHHFGRNREGNLKNLRNLAPDYHFEVKEIPAQEIDEVNISSTKIRNALLAGDVALAKSFLGYHYTLAGKVVEGQGIGRGMGFPTANIEVTDKRKLIPGNGVYACEVWLGEKRLKGMLNIGVRPTVAKGKGRKIEVHIFDLDEDIYEQPIKVVLIERLRDELKFDGIEQLQLQLKTDAIDAKKILAQLPADM